MQTKYLINICDSSSTLIMFAISFAIGKNTKYLILLLLKVITSLWTFMHL